MIPQTLTLSPEQATESLKDAIRAPSVHNSQPWLFRVHEDRIELLADLSRRLPIADPEDRELRIACGAALFNLRLALRQHGVDPRIEVFGAREDGLLAVVEYDGVAEPLPQEHREYRAIARRRTNRTPFAEQGVTRPDRHELTIAAHDERARLDIVLEPEPLAQMHRLLVAAHERQTADPAWQKEFAQWVARSGEGSDGVPLTATGPAPEPQDMWVLRDFGLGQSVVRVPGKDFESQPMIAVLGTYADDDATRLQAGQALQHVLLTATTLGLSVSFLSQLTEDAQARAELREMLGSGAHPQVVMRIGHGSPVPPTPRRPLDDVVV